MCVHQFEEHLLYLFQSKTQIVLKTFVGESLSWRVVVEETITKEANLESDCQEKAGLRWMEQGQGHLKQERTNKKFPKWKHLCT